MAILSDTKQIEAALSANKLSLTRIKTPREILRSLVVAEDPFHLDGLQKAVLDIKESVNGVCIYLPDDCSRFLPKENLKEFTDARLLEILESPHKAEIVSGLSGTSPAALMYILQSTPYRFSHYFQWRELMDCLENSDEIVNFINVVSGIRKRIADALAAEGIQVILMRSGNSVFGKSRHQRSDGWHSLQNAPDTACKFSPIHSSLNENLDRRLAARSTSRESAESPVVKISPGYCVPETLIPLQEGILSLAPNLKNVPTLFELMSSAPPHKAVQILGDAIRGVRHLHQQFGHQHADIRPQNIMAVPLTPSLQKDPQQCEYMGLLLDFESMGRIGDETLVTQNPYYDEGLYFNIRRPRRDADKFAFTISLLEIYLGREGLKMFIHEALPSLAPCLGEKKTRKNPARAVKSFLESYSSRRIVSVMQSGSGRDISHRRIMSSPDGQMLDCISSARGNLNYSLDNVMEVIAGQFVEKNRDRNQYISTTHLEREKFAEQIIRKVRIYDDDGNPVDLSCNPGNLRVCVKFLCQCFESIEGMMVNHARRLSVRPVLESAQIPALQPQLADLLQKKVFPGALHPVPPQTASLLVKLLNLDDAHRPGFPEMLEVISKEK